MDQIKWTSVTWQVLDQPYTQIYYSDRPNYKESVKEIILKNKDKKLIVKQGLGKYCDANVVLTKEIVL